jgi:flagellar hook-associated protein 2
MVMGVSITGLSSGLDTASIVSQLMAIERQPLDRMQTQINKLTSNKSVYQSINTKLANLQSIATDLSSSSFFNSVTSSSSNQAAVTVSNDSTAVAGSYSLQVKSLATVGVYQSGAFTSSTTTLNGMSMTLSYNGQTTTITANASDANDVETLNDLASQINKLNYGVQASVLNTDGSNYHLVLTTKGTGQKNDISFVNDPSASTSSGDAKTYIDTTSQVNLGLAQVQAAQNADFILNGIEVTTQSTNTVTNVIPGVTLNLIGVGTTNITVGLDIDKITLRVNDFVNAYNDIITTIRNQTAKGQPMQGDQTLLSLQDTLFNDLSRVVKNMSGATNIAALVGLEVDPGAVTSDDMTGKITFDQAKFKQALQNDPKSIADLFSFDNDPSTPGPDSNDGIMRFMADSLTSWTSFSGGILTSAITGFNSEISSIDNDMADLNDRLNAKQDALKKQFSDMEVALSSLKSQQSWLTSQLASLSSK